MPKEAVTSDSARGTRWSEASRTCRVTECNGQAERSRDKAARREEWRLQVVDEAMEEDEDDEEAAASEACGRCDISPASARAPVKFGKNLRGG